MARAKNAIRRHLIADMTVDGAVPTESDYKELAKWITDIEDATDEEVEDYADYAGDGTPKSEVISIKEAYSVSGTYDPTDEAQALVASKKRLVGEGRKVWHKIITADEKQEIEGIATLSEIITGSGNASEYEEFGCTIAFDSIPTVEDYTPGA